jgi:hypothetical protein
VITVKIDLLLFYQHFTISGTRSALINNYQSLAVVVVIHHFTALQVGRLLVKNDEGSSAKYCGLRQLYVSSVAPDSNLSGHFRSRSRTNYKGLKLPAVTRDRYQFIDSGGMKVLVYLNICSYTTLMPTGVSCMSKVPSSGSGVASLSATYGEPRNCRPSPIPFPSPPR